MVGYPVSFKEKQRAWCLNLISLFFPPIQTSGESEDDRSSTPSQLRSGRASAQDKWKLGAKKALLQWCRAQVTDKFGIQVRDFGRSWRDGNAFLGIVNSIKPGKMDETTMNEWCVNFKAFQLILVIRVALLKKERLD